MYTQEMAGPFLNFHLSLERNEDGLWARAVDTPAGTALVHVVESLNINDYRDSLTVLNSFQQNGSTSIDAGANETNRTLLQADGARLFQTVFREELALCWQRSLDIAYQTRSFIRLLISYQDASSPHYNDKHSDLPWEYLYDPEQNEFVLLTARVLTMRYVDRLYQIRPLLVEHTLRVLVVVTSPNNQISFDVQREWYNLVDTLDHLAHDGKILFDQLREPTLFGLQRQLRQKKYHVFHFVGYGSYHSATGDGLLHFEDQMGRSKLTSGEHLGSLLRDYDGIRLAVLDIRNELQRQMTRPTFVAVAQSLIRRGLPAAIALHSEMSTFAAITFMDELYTQIADWQPIDVAVANARRAAYLEEQNHSWGLPTLISRVLDGQIFYDKSSVPLFTEQPRSDDAEMSLGLRYRFGL